MHPYFSAKYFPLGHCVVLLPIGSGWQWWWLWGDDCASDFEIYPSQDAARVASNQFADELLAERLEDDMRHRGEASE